jgi:hypothetical protein
MTHREMLRAVRFEAKATSCASSVEPGGGSTYWKSLIRTMSLLDVP